MLIPTDGSEGSLAGARIGIALASRARADVHVLTVVERLGGMIGFGDDAALSTLEEAAIEATEAVANMARDYDAELDVTTVVEQGTPFQSIREYAYRREIDVITMGTKGQTGLNRFLLGSVTENVLRTSRSPVLAVPPEASTDAIDDVTFERLLLPTEGSEGAGIATEWGIALAARMGSTIHALYSVDTSSFSGFQDSEQLLAALERRGEKVLETVREDARDHGVDVSSSITTGPPANAILEYATDHETDMIVLGTHGRTGIGQWFLGSVTENVLRQVDVPVFCVPVSSESP